MTVPIHWLSHVSNPILRYVYDKHLRRSATSAAFLRVFCCASIICIGPTRLWPARVARSCWRTQPHWPIVSHSARRTLLAVRSFNKWKEFHEHESQQVCFVQEALAWELQAQKWRCKQQQQQQQSNNTGQQQSHSIGSFMVQLICHRSVSVSFQLFRLPDQLLSKADRAARLWAQAQQ